MTIKPVFTQVDDAQVMDVTLQAKEQVRNQLNALVSGRIESGLMSVTCSEVSGPLLETKTQKETVSPLGGSDQPTSFSLGSPMQVVGSQQPNGSNRVDQCD